MLVEHFVNLWGEDVEKKEQLIDEVWDMIDRAYAPIGGPHKEKEELLGKTYYWKLVRKGGKIVALRDAAKRDIPNESYKKKKLGFPVPIRDWIKEDDFYNEIKTTFEMDIVDELFDRDNIMKLLDDHKDGVRDNYRKVWAIYSFLKWYKVYFVN